MARIELRYRRWFEEGGDIEYEGRQMLVVDCIPPLEWMGIDIRQRVDTGGPAVSDWSEWSRLLPLEALGLTDRPL